MTIEHQLSSNELYYGYIWWNTKNRHIYQQLFSETKFNVYLGQFEIKNRTADWKRFRAFISKKMRRHYHAGDVIIISKNPKESIVRIWKKRTNNRGDCMRDNKPES